MYLIEHIKIEGLWGKYNIETDLDKDVNIFIGVNGSFKTTLINLVYSILTLKLDLLLTIDFDKVEIKLTKGNSSKLIGVTKLKNKFYEFIVGGQKFQIKLEHRKEKIYNQDFPFEGKTADLKRELENIFKITVLPVNRIGSFDEDQFYRLSVNELKETYLSSVDIKLRALLNRFVRFNSFIKDQKEKKSKYFSDEVQNIVNSNTNDGTSDITRISQEIDNLKKRVEEEKKELDKPINHMIDILNEFFRNKTISISETGDPSVKFNDEKLDIYKLSSGEKQILILFLETLLQRNEKHIFITDEPELSLHIEWQSELIKSIKTLNPNTQIIFATHSPSIISEYRDSVISMGDIIHEKL